jgi:hypothetical protein
MRWLALFCGLLWSASAFAASLTVTGTIGGAVPVAMGETSILPTADHGNANLLIGQQATLGQAASLQSLSFYVTTAAGSMRLGVYDASGPNGQPGALIAQTASFAPVANSWNTKPLSSGVLPAGTYWLAYLPSGSTLGFRVQNGVGTSCLYTFAYAAMPATFSTSPTCITAHWSFYATLVSAPPSLSLTAEPPAPSVAASAPLGTPVATLTAAWSDGSPFTGVYGVDDPSGMFGISGNQVVVRAPLSVGTDDVTITATQ